MSRRGDSAVGQCRLVISEPKTTHSRREVPLHATTVNNTEFVLTPEFVADEN